MNDDGADVVVERSGQGVQVGSANPLVLVYECESAYERNIRRGGDCESAGEEF